MKVGDQRSLPFPVRLGAEWNPTSEISRQGHRLFGFRRAGVVRAVNLGTTVHALPFWVGAAFQIDAQDGFAIVEILFDRRRKRIDFVDDFGY